MAVDADDQVTSNQDCRKLEERVCELEGTLGRKTMEVRDPETRLGKITIKKPCCKYRCGRTFCDEDDRPNA